MQSHPGTLGQSATDLGRVSVRIFDFVFQTFVKIVIEAVKWQDCASGSFEIACLQN